MKFVRALCGIALIAILATGCKSFEFGDDEPAKLAKPQVAKLEPKDLLSVPSWSVGDTWKYSDGYELSVTKTIPDGRTVFQRQDNSNWFTRRGFFREEAKSERVHRHVVYRAPNPLKLFPANHGKPVSFIREYMRNDKLIRHRTSWQIEGRETITVPAGTFDTWVLVWRSDGLDSNWRGYERWYYSPAVRNYVRMEYKYGEAPDGSRVLMSFNVN